MESTFFARRRFLRGAGHGLLVFLLGATRGASAASPLCGGHLVYFGSIGSLPGSGIAAARFDPTSGTLCPLGLVAPLMMATWVLADPKRPILYASTETGDANNPGIASYRIDGATGALRLVDRMVTGGVAATHLSLDASARTVFVAHWGSGHVSAMRIDGGGAVQPAASIVRDQGSGPGPSQQGPRSHSTVLDRGGRALIVADYGADRLFVYRFDPGTRRLAPADPPFLQLAPASGPRHLVLHPNGRFLYLVEELTSKVAAFAWHAEQGRLTPLQALSTMTADYAGKNAGAEIALSADGAFLYVSNRGEDVIVTYAVDRLTGLLEERGRIATGGKTPRSFAIDPSGHWVLVANQDSNEVRVFRRDPASGALSMTEARIALDLPVAMAFAR
jgi:6-phosphogluconolactonase